MKQHSNANDHSAKLALTPDCLLLKFAILLVIRIFSRSHIFIEWVFFPYRLCVDPCLLCWSDLAIFAVTSTTTIPVDNGIKGKSRNTQPSLEELLLRVIWINLDLQSAIEGVF